MNIEKIIFGYLEAAIFTDEEIVLEETGEQIDIGQFSNDTKEKVKSDIEKFISLAGETAINEAIETNGDEYLGHDIWLTRNGHGAGFFDRGYTNETLLEAAAEKLGTVHLFFQDGEILME